MSFLSVVIPAYIEASAILHGKLQKVADWLAAKHRTELIKAHPTELWQ